MIEDLDIRRAVIQSEVDQMTATLGEEFHDEWSVDALMDLEEQIQQSITRYEDTQQETHSLIAYLALIGLYQTLAHLREGGE